MKTKNIIFIIIAAIVLIGFYMYDQAKKALQYDYFFTGIRFSKIGLQKTSGQVDLKITNPSDLALKIEEINLKMYINGVFISDLSSKIPFVIEKKKYFEVPLGFEMEPHLIFSISNIGALQGILNAETTMITITGQITAKKGIFRFKYPVYFHDPISKYI